MRYYPAFLNTTNRQCIVIGGGQIAERKINELLHSDAVVMVISPRVSPSIQALAEDGKLKWVPREYRPGDLTGSFLTIAATDDHQINSQVHAEAEKEKSLVNVVDVPDLCDFIAPAIIERGQVTVAISTGGASPALARKIRESLEIADELKWADTADVVGTVRLELRQREIVVDPETWQGALDERFLRLATTGRDAAAAAHLLSSLLGSRKNS